MAQITKKDRRVLPTGLNIDNLDIFPEIIGIELEKNWSGNIYDKYDRRKFRQSRIKLKQLMRDEHWGFPYFNFYRKLFVSKNRVFLGIFIPYWIRYPRRDMIIKISNSLDKTVIILNNYKKFHKQLIRKRLISGYN